jgi:hypothetical protein
MNLERFRFNHLLEKDAHEFFTREKLPIISCDGASRLSSRAQLAFFAS